MKLGIIVQARLGSTRYPGKVLKPFYGNNCLLDVVLDKLHQVDDTPVIVAITDTPQDDKLYEYLISRSELVYRGSEQDVLSRFIGAAECYNIDAIIRICSDNPFIDYNGLKELINKAHNSNADYIGYQVNNIPSIKTHFGFWGEYVSLNALKRVSEISINDNHNAAREHVTIYIYTHPDVFHCEWIDVPQFLKDRNDIRLTVDTVDDFTNAKRVYGDLVVKKSNYSIRDIIEYLDCNKVITDTMKVNIKNNTK